jgi:pimeloyl-ACP methyl ester carboxylesterase
MNAYEAMLNEWPVAYQTRNVVTQHGSTHVISCGDSLSTPLILLHAGYASSTMWFPNILEFSQHRMVYAIDTIGEPGKSIPAHSLPGKQEMADWLIGVMAGLGIYQADFVGLSRGGWLATNLAILAPQKVRKLCLLSPAAAFVSLNKFFNLVASSVIRVRIDVVLRTALYSWVAKGFKINPAFEKQFIIGLKYWMYPKVGIMPVAFEDDELLKLSMPALMLIGGEDRLNSQPSIQRARKYLPNIKAEIIPFAGHFLSMDQASIVNGMILDFLDA